MTSKLKKSMGVFRFGGRPGCPPKSTPMIVMFNVKHHNGEKIMDFIKDKSGFYVGLSILGQ